MAALTCVCTLVVRVPVPGTHGYVNMGDGILMLAALLFGPKIGFAAGAVGSALADIAGGYAIYAPVTFFVKGLEGAALGFIAHRHFSEKPSSFRTFLGFGIASFVLVGGYFAAEFFMFGFPAALAGIFANCGQALAGCALALATGTALSKVVRRSY